MGVCCQCVVNKYPIMVCDQMSSMSRVHAHLKWGCAICGSTKKEAREAVWFIVQHGAATAKSLWQYVWGSRQVSGCRSAKIPTSEAQDNTQNTFLNVLEAAPVMRSSLGRIFKSVQGENGRFAIALQRTRYSGHHFSRLMRDASNKRLP